jgi:hypothetical protein
VTVRKRLAATPSFWQHFPNEKKSVR